MYSSASRRAVRAGKHAGIKVLNMRAAVLHEVRDIRVTEIPTPTPAADEVIVKVKAVGVCGSDLHSYLEGGTKGPTRINPFVLGHEFSGTLTPETAKRAGLPADALIAVDPSISCGRCEWCHRGHTNLCPNVRFLGYAPNNGAMAEFICVPTSALHIVPDSIDPAGAAILETLGVAIHAMDLARPRLMETVAVLGCGPVGLLLIQLARLAGAGKIVAIDPIRNGRISLAILAPTSAAAVLKKRRRYRRPRRRPRYRGDGLLARLRACRAQCPHRWSTRHRRNPGE